MNTELAFMIHSILHLPALFNQQLTWLCVSPRWPVNKKNTLKCNRKVASYKYDKLNVSSLSKREANVRNASAIIKIVKNLTKQA